MTNEKTEFKCKGIPSELITDNGNGYQNKQVVRGDSKYLMERNFHKLTDENIKAVNPDSN
ncbi:MAG: hypothetical protein ACI9YH_000159 [Colwellia sp.]|jgi:hypothetical protein